MSHRTRRRLSTVALAPLAALAAWAVIRLVGVDLDVTAGDGTVDPGDVCAAALTAALAGWVVVRFIERHTRRPRDWWAFIASTALALSMVGPSWLADGSSALALMTLHVMTALVVISGFATTLPARR
jgi:hypothetical protein